MAAAAFRSLPLAERQRQHARVAQIHPDKVPLILERAPSASVPVLPLSKYLVPRDYTVAALLGLIRERTAVAHDQALFVYVCGTVPASNATFGALYDAYRDPDGFLYVVYTGESSFGAS